MLHTAVKQFQTNTGRLPTKDEGLQVLIEKPQDWPDEIVWQSYLDCTALPSDPWGNEFKYMAHDKLNSHFVVYSIGPEGLSHSLKYSEQADTVATLLPIEDRELLNRHQRLGKIKSVFMICVWIVVASATFIGMFYIKRMLTSKRSQLTRSVRLHLIVESEPLFRGLLGIASSGLSCP